MGGKHYKLWFGHCIPTYQSIQMNSNDIFKSIFIQENFIKNGSLAELILSPEINSYGDLLIPVINRYASAITTFRPVDKQFQDGKMFYPGQDSYSKECQEKSPHAKWHVQSGIAMVDLVFVADEIYHLIEKYENIE